MPRTRYNVDNAHSAVRFVTRHMMFTKVHGRFTRWSVEVEADPANPSDARVDVRIETASIDTGEAKRDEHLRSPDFFDAARHPEIRFTGKQVEKKGADRFRLVGDLSMHGITREVALDVERLGEGKNPWGQQVVGLLARGELNRKDFGLTWNQVLETGGVLVGENIQIEVELQATAQTGAAKAA